jgi:hypothetical protein
MRLGQRLSRLNTAHHMQLYVPHSTNLFLALGKYVQGQEENLLTQALVLLFNRVAPFRKAFIDQLRKRSGQKLVSNDDFIAHSQVRRTVGSGSIVVDLEIYWSGKPVPIYLVESKLDAGLGPEQINKYKAALTKLPRSTRFVVLTKRGTDDDLRNIAPSRTIWLSWPFLAELVELSSKHASLVNQLLIKDFLEMLRLKGMETIPPMTKESFGRLAKITDFAFNPAKGLLGRDWNAVSLALRRVEEHRDEAWESMFSSADGWKPFQGVHKEDGHVLIHAGFYQWKPSKKIQQRFISIELHCTKHPHVQIIHGWYLGPKHQRYKKSESIEYEEGWITTPFTRRFFTMDMPSALDYAEPSLRKRARVFLRSKYMRSE